MPRPRDTDKEPARQRTERWRASRRIAGRPEASIIDRAVAASFSAYLSASLRYDSLPEFTLRDVVMGAQRMLVLQGYDKRESNSELMRRMTRRADLAEITIITGASGKTR